MMYLYRYLLCTPSRGREEVVEQHYRTTLRSYRYSSDLLLRWCWLFTMIESSTLTVNIISANTGSFSGRKEYRSAADYGT